MVLGGPVMSLISYTGFMFVPLGHGSVIQPSCATLGGLLLAALFLKERISASHRDRRSRPRRRDRRHRERAAVFPACVPALTLLTGWLLLGEPPTALQAAGLVTVLCGFYLAQRQR